MAGSILIAFDDYIRRARSTIMQRRFQTFFSYIVTMASTSDDERQAQMTNEDRKTPTKKKCKTTIDSSQENVIISYFESKPKTIPAAGSDEHLLFGTILITTIFILIRKQTSSRILLMYAEAGWHLLPRLG